MKIHLTLLDPWHCGSGSGQGAMVDAEPIKDEVGLPFVPGRTLRGLFREAVTMLDEAGGLPAGQSVDQLFGRPSGEHGPASIGALRFGSAELPADLRRWVSTHAERGALAEALSTTIASTAIEEDGLAKDHSLRQVAFAIPVELIAEVHGPLEDIAWVEVLERCAPLIRGLGHKRHRGFGRVQVRTEVV